MIQTKKKSKESLIKVTPKVAVTKKKKQKETNPLEDIGITFEKVEMNEGVCFFIYPFTTTQPMYRIEVFKMLGCSDSIGDRPRIFIPGATFNGDLLRAFMVSMAFAEIIAERHEKLSKMAEEKIKSSLNLLLQTLMSSITP